MIFSATELLKAKGYKLEGVRNFQGLIISIENKRGTYREGVDSDGHKWRTLMHLDYGGIRATEGKDHEYVDVYIGPARDSQRVYVVHQNDPVTGSYDEDKVLLGMRTAKEAKKAYLRQYDRPGFFGSMDYYRMDEFKGMLKDRKGLKLKKSKENNMKTTENQGCFGKPECDEAVEGETNRVEKRVVKRKKRARPELKSLSDDEKNGVDTKINTFRKDVQLAILNKIVKLVREGKLDLLDAGVIEGRLNKGIDLSPEHYRALGLDYLLKGSHEEQLKPFSRPVGNKALRVNQADPRKEAARAERAPDSLSAHKQSGIYEFHSMKTGVSQTVGGVEILKAVERAVAAGSCDLATAGQIEYRINHGGKIPESALRDLFA